MAITEYIGIYHADGGLVGEAKYVVGHILGRTHCALCDITHSPVRRKKQWDAYVDTLGVPFLLYHLNEMPADVAARVASAGSPVVLGRTDTDLVVLLGPEQLDRLDGSVSAFARALAMVAAPPTAAGTD